MIRYVVVACVLAAAALVAAETPGVLGPQGLPVVSGADTSQQPQLETIVGDINAEEESGEEIDEEGDQHYKDEALKTKKKEGCFNDVYGAIHCIHKFHITIDTPHMWHDVHHLAHSVQHQKWFQDARNIYTLKGQAIRTTFGQWQQAEKIVAMEKTLATTIQKAQQELQAMKSAAANGGTIAAEKISRLSKRISELTQTLAQNSENVQAAKKYLIDYAKAFEEFRVKFARRIRPALNALRRGGNAAKLAPVMERSLARLSALKTPALRGASRVLRFVTSEGFGKAVIVVAAVLEGVHKAETTHAVTTMGKVANVLLAAGGAALVMANPWIALADVALGFIPGGEKWKPSKLVQCTGDAVVSLAEGMITGDPTMMNRVSKDMESGKCGIILQMAHEAGKYWSEMGFKGGMKQFFDDMAYAYDSWRGAMDDMWRNAFSAWNEHVRKAIDSARASIGDVSPELLPSKQFNPSSLKGVKGTYVNLKGCKKFPDQNGNRIEPYFQCVASPCQPSGASRCERTTEVPDNYNGVGGLAEYDSGRGGFGMFFRDSPNAVVKCTMSFRWRFGTAGSSWLALAGKDEHFSNTFFQVGPQFTQVPNGDLSKYTAVQLGGAKPTTCDVMYAGDMSAADLKLPVRA